jgi:hypothetical protein
LKIFGKFYYEKEDLARLIDKSEPVTGSDISILKISEKYGWVDILIKNNNSCFSVKYSSFMFDVSDLIEYLAELIDLKDEALVVFDNEGSDPLFYSKPISDDIIRFLFASDYRIYDLFDKDKIEDYDLTDFDIEFDVLVDKKRLLNDFYNVLYFYIANYELDEFDLSEINIEKSKKYLNKIAEYLKRPLL